MLVRGMNSWTNRNIGRESGMGRGEKRERKREGGKEWVEKRKEGEGKG